MVNQGLHKKLIRELYLLNNNMQKMYTIYLFTVFGTFEYSQTILLDLRIIIPTIAKE